MAYRDKATENEARTGRDIILDALEVSWSQVNVGVPSEATENEARTGREIILHPVAPAVREQGMPEQTSEGPSVSCQRTPDVRLGIAVEDLILTKISWRAHGVAAYKDTESEHRPCVEPALRKACLDSSAQQRITSSQPLKPLAPSRIFGSLEIG